MLLQAIRFARTRGTIPHRLYPWALRLLQGRYARKAKREATRREVERSVEKLARTPRQQPAALPAAPMSASGEPLSFDAIDANKDGAISKEEWRSAFMASSPPAQENTGAARRSQASTMASSRSPQRSPTGSLEGSNAPSQELHSAGRSSRDGSSAAEVASSTPPSSVDPKIEPTVGSVPASPMAFPESFSLTAGEEDAKAQLEAIRSSIEERRCPIRLGLWSWFWVLSGLDFRNLGLGT